MKIQIAVLAGLFVLIQYRMDLLGLVLGGPQYDPQVHGEVVLLKTQTCVYCKREAAYLRRHDVPFQAFDVADDARAAELLQATGNFTVPVLLVGDEVVRGFNPLAIRAAFARVAQAAGEAPPDGAG